MRCKPAIMSLYLTVRCKLAKVRSQNCEIRVSVGQLLKNIFPLAETLESFLRSKNRLISFSAILFCHFHSKVSAWRSRTPNPRMQWRFVPDSGFHWGSNMTSLSKNRGNSAIIVQHWSRKSAEVAVGAARLLLSFRLRAWRKD